MSENNLPKVELDLPEPYQPTMGDLLDFASTAGLVEEKENFLLLTLATINKVSCGVESTSGSGKSTLTDILMLLIPSQRVYNLGLTSNTATMYDFKALNSADIVYIEELQKAMNSGNVIVIELLKNLTEGKKLTRKVYDSLSRKVINQKIKGDIGVVYSLALENKQKKDDELDRRVITFMTDISQQQNRKVVRHIGKTRFNKKRLKIQSTEIAQSIKDHINIVMDLAKEEVDNPFADYISKKIPVPFTISRSYIKHYFNLIDSSTKFHFKARIKKEDRYFTSLQDVYNIHLLYGKMFNQKIHNLPQLGIEIIRIFDGTEKNKGWRKDKNKEQYQLFTDDEGADKVYMDITKVHKALKANGILLKHKVIHDQCDLLVEAGFLGKELNGRKTFFFKTDDIDAFEDGFDFKSCMEDGIKNMKEHYPEYLDEWLKPQQDKEGKIILEHPITKELINLEDIKVEETKDKVEIKMEWREEPVIDEEIVK